VRVDGGEDGRGEGARGQARPVESLPTKRASKLDIVRLLYSVLFLLLQFGNKKVSKNYTVLAVRVVYLETAVTVGNICASGTNGTYGRFLKKCLNLEPMVAVEFISVS
jgi:hypothetical protein